MTRCHHHWQRCSILTSGLIAMTLASLAWLSTGAGEANAAGMAQSGAGPSQNGSPCLVDLQQRARPGLMLLGETTELEIRARATCPKDLPLHLVLVVDGSGSMVGQPNQETKDALRDFVQALDLPQHPMREVGVVEFNSSARTLCRLSKNLGQVVSCIGRIGASGGTNIDGGVLEGLEVLLHGRSPASGPAMQEVMVVLTDGQNNAGCPSLLDAARTVEGQGVLLITICIGANCDAACMMQAASSQDHFFEEPSSLGLPSVFDRIDTILTGIALRQFTVATFLPENMEYVPNSAKPPASHWPDHRILEWQGSLLSASGISLSFHVRPLEVGGHPVARSTVIEFQDAMGGSGTLETDPPWVHVFYPAVQPRP